MRALVFSGTTEGKKIAEYLNSKRIETLVCVATEYGAKVMEPMEYVRLSIGRLDMSAMAQLAAGADFVIDATHPYASEVTQNIRKACDKAAVRYIRLLRDEITEDGVTAVESVEQAVNLLKAKNGGIFVSTGSKELEKYTALEDYSQRLTVRVLPFKDAHDKCTALGLKNVIYQKGPFSYGQNIAHFKANNVKWLVTKSSGTSGGFYEKVSAAKSLNMGIIVIKRPHEYSGLTETEVKNIIDEMTGGLKNVF